MLKIDIKKEYKSIAPCTFELPCFSVLTGLNGSGKSHLLEAIFNQSQNTVHKDGVLVKNILYIQFNGLNPKIEENCDPVTITTFVKDFYQKFKNALNNSNYQNNKNKGTFLQTFYNPNEMRIATKFVDKIDIPFDEVDENYLIDIFDTSMMSQDDFFTGQFALIFKNYHKLLEENKINKYYKDQGHTDISHIYSEEEFNQKYGIPPWEFVNSILESINVPYRVNSPLGTRMDASYTFKLISIDGTYNISPQDLSTGEKVLMSLALAIYNSNGKINKPDLLLIDEPDAPLHPSMSKKMVEILKEKIVELSNIPIIITSHSPTTIICCDGSAVYKMERGVSTPIKTSIQDAIETLSSDIPFLKISNDNRRQVFVESKYDVKYYELITNILNRIATMQSEPIYIPARTSTGSNCTDVINVVNNLFDNGNEQVYGIIDWDTTNISLNRIIVLGENERYNIENYILDPLLMGLFFLREAKITYQEMGLNGYSSYADLQSLKNDDCQIIIDFVLTKLGIDLSNKTNYFTHNETELSICLDFNIYQGHDLETLYKSKFPFLHVYQREDTLKAEVINKIINDFPYLAPKELYQTILKIK
ncbi:ATP-binding protein [Chryseobacterium sp. SC28]|uniref:ATP-binding protein n=1 Tax=Chryseobacterium sp. SC28 TaxID=2268028 RepID=UPI000F649DE7|nr:AAA family ATPase [Chryseobacterium sp. SC28]RRQ46872.1 ATP-binding cassette domain-containing protein [Chryseobacterium sp. SC28]